MACAQMPKSGISKFINSELKRKQVKRANQPPKGMHRDGRDYVLVLLIKRVNIKSGITSIQDLAKNKLDEFTLTHPFDAALLDDNRVYHGVTAVEPLDPTQRAYRDVLVVTFHAL